MIITFKTTIKETINAAIGLVTSEERQTSETSFKFLYFMSFIYKISVWDGGSSLCFVLQIRQVLGPIACHCFTRRMARRGLCGGGESLRSVVKSQRPPSSRLFFLWRRYKRTQRAGARRADAFISWSWFESLAWFQHRCSSISHSSIYNLRAYKHLILDKHVTASSNEIITGTGAFGGSASNIDQKNKRKKRAECTIDYKYNNIK